MCKHSQVLLITQVRKFETHPPSPGMAAEPDLSQIPPSDIPDALQDGIGKLSTPLKQLLMGKSVPYLIQHRLGTENYVTVEDLADRWDTAQGAKRAWLEANRNGFTVASSGFAAMKLFQVVRATKEDLDSFYDWFYGPEMGGRRPSPPEQTFSHGRTQCMERGP